MDEFKAGLIRTLWAIALSCGAVPVARADDSSWALDRADLYLGSFVNDLALKSRVSGTVASSDARLDGTEIDFGSDFDFGGSRSVLLMGVAWRPFERHQFSFDSFRNSREQSAHLTREIEFRDRIFPVDAAVSARFEYHLYEAKYTYWAWISQQDAFGLSTGLADYRVDLRLSGRASVDDNQTTQSTTERAGSDVPAPLVGLDYRHAFSRDLRLFADISTFNAKINNIDGNVVDARAGFEYFPWKHLGVAAVAAFYRINVNLEKSGFQGDVNLRSSGYQLLLHVR